MASLTPSRLSAESGPLVVDGLADGDTISCAIGQTAPNVQLPVRLNMSCSIAFPPCCDPSDFAAKEVTGDADASGPTSVAGVGVSGGCGDDGTTSFKGSDSRSCDMGQVAPRVHFPVRLNRWHIIPCSIAWIIN